MTWLRSLLAVGATYFFFLIFAQFAFLTHVKTFVTPEQLEPILAAMGVSGLLASLGWAYALRRLTSLRVLRWGFLGCGVLSWLAPQVHAFAGLLAVSACIGVALAAVTVSLASGLLCLTGPRQFGLKLGVGVGFAYFACNLPWVFQASSTAQSQLAAFACILGSFSVQGVVSQELCHQIPQPSWRDTWFGGRGLALVVLLFFALIWMDSALFYVIQETPSYKQLTWSTRKLGLNALFHLLFALLAGFAIDRGWFRALLGAAYLLLATGALVLDQAAFVAWASPLYVAGVSLYSVALVAVPSLAAVRAGLPSRAWRAAWLYGLAGWVGSAMGIGMARDLARIPYAFLIVAGCVLLVASSALRRLPAVLGVFVVLALCQCHSPSLSTPEARGRQVYINEGCIHCHSQYHRPGTDDEERWGPASELASALLASPPLFGNRRIGPDLAAVGARRSPEWQRVHLLNPQALTPRSNMPAYPHLFEDQRGPDLVAYLNSLGADQIATRWTQTQTWQPNQDARASADRGPRLFQELCAGCHGARGLADGPVAALLSQPVRNLRSDRFRYFQLTSPQARVQLARIIKFGIPGTSMPGHETLSDEEVLGLVETVFAFQKPSAGHVP